MTENHHENLNTPEANESRKNQIQRYLSRLVSMTTTVTEAFQSEEHEKTPEQTRIDIIKELRATVPRRSWRRAIASKQPLHPEGQHFANEFTKSRFTKQGVVLIEKVLPATGVNLFIKAKRLEETRETDDL